MVCIIKSVNVMDGVVSSGISCQIPLVKLEMYLLGVIPQAESAPIFFSKSAKSFAFTDLNDKLSARSSLVRH